MKIFNNNEFGELKIMLINNEPCFIGKEVAAALGYSNTRKALIDHVDSEDKVVTKCDTPGGAQEMTIINESGLYSLIFGSKLEKAKQFKKWVTNEVLPTIRKTGGYVNNTEQFRNK
ncbi:toxin-antitoxin system, toxin component, Bro family protein [Clostridium beijerinckii]|uniref:Toxin-antitoxin system, toxin component, Bro family protein n=2 Tax=Clostridium beijerinckii TaxID=1520 RepID=A0AAW3WA24_CLOBE|nr:toxin-antitoxin system, toxin component, Bro family protein [Clostridium beijerinckii]MBC2475364.1 toxin-antitoxin system, toxin component, Bro family protein [Clostridium beijerinckii]